MAHFDVIEETAGGWQKVEYTNLGTTGYRTPDGEAQSSWEERTGKSAPHAFSASKGQEQSVTVRDTETGQIITRTEQSKTLSVEGQAEAGERGASSDSATFEVQVSSVEQARSVLEENRSSWEAWQIFGLWEFVCKDTDDGDGVVVGGWSRVKDGIQQEEYREPQIGVADDGSEELQGWRTTTADTVEVAYQEASDNAWAKVTCSVAEWVNLEIQVKMYADPQSGMLQQARSQSHILLEEL